MAKQPPEVNGIMDLTDAEKTDITSKLQAIVTAFVATDDAPVCDTFYITSTYNKANPSAPINGDTCSSLLAPAEATPSTGV